MSRHGGSRKSVRFRRAQKAPPRNIGAEKAKASVNILTRRLQQQKAASASTLISAKSNFKNNPRAVRKATQQAAFAKQQAGKSLEIQKAFSEGRITSQTATNEINKLGGSLASRRSKARNRGRKAGTITSTVNKQGGRDLKVNLRETLTFKDSATVKKSSGRVAFPKGANIFQFGRGINLFKTKEVTPTITSAEVEKRLSVKRVRKAGLIRTKPDLGEQEIIDPTKRVLLPAAEPFRDAARFAADTPKFAESLKGFQGDAGTGTLAPDTSTLSPTPFTPSSKFVLIGGRAVPRDAIPDNLFQAFKAGSLGVSEIPTVGKDGQPLDPEIIKIFSRERDVTLEAQRLFTENRNLALANGLTVDEAVQFAQAESKGVSKQDATDFNTIFQKNIIEKKAGGLQAAEEAIKAQTTGGTAGELDDLASIVANAEPIPATVINITPDETGNISTRRAKVQLENALLTGNTLSDLAAVSNGQKVSGVFTTDENGQVLFNGNIISQSISPNIIQGLETGDTDIGSQILRDMAEGRVSGALLPEVKAGTAEPFSPEEFQQIITAGAEQKQFDEAQTTILKTEQFFNEILEGEQFSITEISDGLVELTAGDFTITGTPEEIADFLESVKDLFSDESSAALFEGNADLISILTTRISELEALLRGGQFDSAALANFFNLFADLQRQLAGQNQLIDDLRNALQPDEENPFADFFAFLGGIGDSIVSLFTGQVNR